MIMKVQRWDVLAASWDKNDFLMELSKLYTE